MPPEGSPAPGQFDSWESYHYPDTWNGFSGVLKNNFDLRDADRLQKLEESLSLRALDDLASGVAEVDRTYDTTHVQAIHRHVFGRVYPWAGALRTFTMTKDRTVFRAGDVKHHLDAATQVVAATDWPNLSKTEFADATARLYGHLNLAHPFREGNGRTGKEFVRQVAELSNFRLDYRVQTSGISKDLWNYVSAMSVPTPPTFAPDITDLKKLFYSFAQPALGGPSRTLPERAVPTPENALTQTRGSVTARIKEALANQPKIEQTPHRIEKTPRTHRGHSR